MVYRYTSDLSSWYCNSTYMSTPKVLRYMLRKLAGLLLLTFTFPGYWEGDTPKVQQQYIFAGFIGGFLFTCSPSVFFFVIGFFWRHKASSKVPNHFNCFPFPVFFNQVFKSSLLITNMPMTRSSIRVRVAFQMFLSLQPSPPIYLSIIQTAQLSPPSTTNAWEPRMVNRQTQGGGRFLASQHDQRFRLGRLAKVGNFGKHNMQQTGRWSWQGKGFPPGKDVDEISLPQ